MPAMSRCAAHSLQATWKSTVSPYSAPFWTQPDMSEFHIGHSDKGDGDEWQRLVIDQTRQAETVPGK